ncbi:hypothetical protein AMTRI_Chr03g45130 [Amborella trichopoda]
MHSSRPALIQKTFSLYPKVSNLLHLKSLNISLHKTLHFLSLLSKYHQVLWPPKSSLFLLFFWLWWLLCLQVLHRKVQRLPCRWRTVRASRSRLLELLFQLLSSPS